MNRSLMWMPFLGLVLCACSAGGDEGTTPPNTPTATQEPQGEGTLAVSFRMNPDDIQTLVAPPKGAFYGDVYSSDDISGQDIVDGAQSLETIFINRVEITPQGGPTPKLYVTQNLTEGSVVIVGFLDINNNADSGDPKPDEDDPRAVVEDNLFLVVPELERSAEVYLKPPPP